MREQEPVTQTMKASEARAQFSAVLNQVYRKQKRVVVEKSGIPVAAIVSAEDLQALQRLEEQRSADFDVLFRIGDAFKGVPDAELAREVSAALTQVRAEQRRHEGQPAAAE
jgi:prevent-host-death family protein